MHGRRALSEQDCWSDIGGVVLRDSHDGMDGPTSTVSVCASYTCNLPTLFCNAAGVRFR
jgi:hypothetical protein